MVMHGSNHLPVLRWGDGLVYNVAIHTVEKTCTYLPDTANITISEYIYIYIYYKSIYIYMYICIELSGKQLSQPPFSHFSFAGRGFWAQPLQKHGEEGTASVTAFYYAVFSCRLVLDCSAFSPLASLCLIPRPWRYRFVRNRQARLDPLNNDYRSFHQPGRAIKLLYLVCCK